MARYRTNLDNFEFGFSPNKTSIVQAYTEAKKKFLVSLKNYFEETKKDQRSKK